jgi:hypothetical protein
MTAERGRDERYMPDDDGGTSFLMRRYVTMLP